MKKINQLLSRYLVIACVVAPSVVQSAETSDFIDFSLREANNAIALPGRLYIPSEATNEPASRRPLIVFLHGSGEAGQDNVNQINGNIDNLLAEAKRRGAFLCAPQAPGEEWRDEDVTRKVVAMVDRAIAEQKVDPSRIYVTGLSSGGGGIWNLLSRFPARFAAAISISGDMPAPDFVAANLVGTPILAFHSRDDDTVPVAEDRGVITGVLSAASVPPPSYPATGSNDYFLVFNPNLAPDKSFADRVRQQREITDYAINGAALDLIYGELPKGGHGIWPKVYSSPEIYDWLFAHTLGEKRPTAK